MPQIREEYIKTGKLRYVFRDLPLESIHPQAFKAAEAANCANEQGKFWEMHYRLFENQRALAPTNLTQHAQAVGLDTERFAQCLAEGKYVSEVRKDMGDAQRLGAQGTPHFVIGLANAKDPRDLNVKIVKQIVGAQPFSVFKTAIDEALAEASK